jgi:hypothetical protein
MNLSKPLPTLSKCFLIDAINFDISKDLLESICHVERGYCSLTWGSIFEMSDWVNSLVRE